MILRLLFLLLGFPLFCHSQITVTDPDLPGSALVSTLYSDADLNEIANLQPAKLEAIWYYYTQSFILEPLKGDEHIPFDVTHFDISKYEHLRQKDSRRVKEDPKRGFRLTLLSTEELQYKLPVHSPQIPVENEDN
ncbi:MAG: hypothetical protein ACO1O6_14125 [Bacteroidota bacterium]